MNDALAMKYFGTTQAVDAARRLNAGPWSALFVDGKLRDIRHGDIEVIREVAFLVRDKDWGTCRPVLSDIHIDEADTTLRVSCRAQCTNPDGHVLDYALSMTCAADGDLALHASVSARDAFLAARCGFCVLHPIDGVAGAPARVAHGDGTSEQGAFPVFIDPWQPFKDIRAIEHELSCGLKVRCAFTGDVFEMEDQRNWSDASFKTYSRPLEWPWPYTIEAGVAQEQSVVLSVDAARRLSVPSRASDVATIGIDCSDEVGEKMPGIGIAIAAHEIDAVLEHIALLTELAPRQLTLSFDPTTGHGLHELQRFAGLQRRAGIDAVLEYALPGVDDPRIELKALAAMIESAKLDVSGIVVSPSVHRQSNPPGSISPPCPALDDVYRAAREAFPRLRIGGGVLSYFTELNRKRPPLGLVDWVTHATCPIVHAADDRSVMQTLEAIPHITRSCRALIGAQAYAIGPVSIGMRQNPYGSRVMPNPHGERVAMAANDPRQGAQFGAAWLAGYAAALEGAGIETLTLGALTGVRGLADVDGVVRRYPMFEVAKFLAGASGLDRLRIANDASAEIASVAARNEDGSARLLLANLTDAERRVRIEIKDASAMNETVLSPFSVVSMTVSG